MASWTDFYTKRRLAEMIESPHTGFSVPWGKGYGGAGGKRGKRGGGSGARVLPVDGGGFGAGDGHCDGGDDAAKADESGRAVLVCVRDSGRGISKADLQRVFLFGERIEADEVARHHALVPVLREVAR